MPQKPKDAVREFLQDPHSGAVVAEPAPNSSRLPDDSTGPSPSEQKETEEKSSDPDCSAATEQGASASSKEAHGPFSKAHSQWSEYVTVEQPGSNSRGVDGSVGTVVQPVKDKDGAVGTVVQPDTDQDGAVGTTLSGSHSSSWLDDAADFVNEHLRAFRAIPWVLGGLGAILVIRYTHMFTRFRRASDIPRRLYAQNSRLSGIAATTHWNAIGVWHVPIARRLLSWKHYPPSPCSAEDLLRVEFAGVAIGDPEGSERWLGTHLRGRRVWCTLLHPTPDGEAAQCVVYARKKGFLRSRFSVNEELLAQGLGSIDDTMHGFHSNEDYVHFAHGMVKVEQVAKRKGVGMWEGGEYETWWRRGRRWLTSFRRREES